MKEAPRLTFAELQADFVRHRKGAGSLPISGIVNYSFAAIASLIVPARYANLVLVLCFWAIPPVAALIGRVRHEDFTGDPANPLFRLSKVARIMVLSTWSIHIPVWIFAPALLPLTIGVAFALHWVIFSWSTGHPAGFVHLGLRSIGVPAIWYLCPANRMGAVAAFVAICYLVSVMQLRRMDWQMLAKKLDAQC